MRKLLRVTFHLTVKVPLGLMVMAMGLTGVIAGLLVSLTIILIPIGVWLSGSGLVLMAIGWGTITSSDNLERKIRNMLGIDDE